MLAEPNAAQELTFGATGSPHSLEIPAAALETVYGTTSAGEVHLTAVVLAPRHAPAPLLARVAGTTIPLRARSIVQLSASQPRAALRLKARATLSLTGLDASADAAGEPDREAGRPPQLYRLDETDGTFVREPAAYDESQGVLRAEITRFGTYAAAVPAVAQGCVSGRIETPDGAPLVGAALRFSTASNREAGSSWTDRDGRYCLALETDQAVSIRALGLHDGRLHELIHDEARSSAVPGACGSDACADAGTRVATTPAVGCVRGRILAPGFSMTTVRVVDAHGTGGDGEGELDPSQSDLVVVRPSETFCLDVTRETQLAVEGPGLTCGAPRALPAPGRAIGCGEDGCADLGDIRCCAMFELCGDEYDGDCDDLVDEGCACTSPCTEPHQSHPALPNRCCTETSTCGFRFPTSDPVDHCFEFTGPSPYTSLCPAETLAVRDQTLAPTGCCRSDNQCGLTLHDNCLPRTEVHHLTGVPLAPIACTYAP